MTPFRVWIRYLGPSCRVRVDGLANTHWLLRRLTQSFVFKSAEPLAVADNSSIYNFCVPYTPPLTRSRLESLLAAIPEVQLMPEPE